MITLIKKIISAPIYFLFTLLGFLSVFPLFLLSQYNHPSTDDFNYSLNLHDYGFFKDQLLWYNGWSGRYFSTALLSINPLVYHNFLLYKFIPVVLIILFISSFYFFSGSLINNLSAKKKIAFSAVICFLYIYQLPDICQAFFWLSGSITYLLANILFMFLLVLLLEFYRTKKLIYFFAACILCFFTIGSNETIMVSSLFLFLLFLIIKYFYTKKIDKYLLILFTLTIAFSIVVISSPGNTIRGNYFINNNHLFLQSIIKSVIYSFYYISIWTSIILLVFILVINYCKDLSDTLKSKNIFFIHPLASFTLCIIMVCMGFFLSFWSMGIAPPKRTINTIYFFYILSFSYSLITLYVYLENREKNSFFISNPIQYLILIVLVSSSFSSVNIKNIYSDLLTSRAFYYDQQMTSRYNLIKNSKSSNYIVPPIKDTPITIFNEDITTDVTNWKNEAYAKYFKKESIKTSQELSGNQ